MLMLSCSENKEEADVAIETIKFTYDYKNKPSAPTNTYRAIFNDETDISGANFGISGFTKIGEVDIVHSTESEWAYLILAHFEHDGTTDKVDDYKLKYSESMSLFGTEMNSYMDTLNNYYGRKKIVFTENRPLGNLFSKDSILLGISFYNDYSESFATKFKLIHKEHFPGGGRLKSICKLEDDKPLEILRWTGGVNNKRTYSALFLFYWDRESDREIKQFIEEDLVKVIFDRNGCEHLNENQIAITEVIKPEKTPKNDNVINIHVEHGYD